MNNTNNLPAKPSEILIYRTEDGQTHLETKLVGETVWLSLNQMADLFQRDKSVIAKHIKNVFKDKELPHNAVVANFATTAADGKIYQVEYFNLDVIISVGYRVKSRHGVQFRMWATQRLKEYIVKGFTLDDERLKGIDRRVDYFDELLARIREIRASEARVYQRIREIFALASDYVEEEQETKIFFATMQNKMHFAAAGLTAAEIIRKRADAAQPNMGLTAWRGGRVLKRDVTTAKNYLAENEINTLNRITVMFLDQAEFRAERRKDIRMRDWETFLDKFLRDTELPVLSVPGSVSHDEAFTWAQDQYAAFSGRRRLEAESVAESKYLDDLRKSAKTLENGKIKRGKNGKNK